MKRFYSAVSVAEQDGTYRVLLDSRPIKTAAGNAQLIPNGKLAQALVGEWAAQSDQIDPALFRFRDLVDYAIDIARPERASVIDKLLAFAETDTLCYRADPDEALYRRQLEVWEPLLARLETREGISLERISGIVHRSQPENSLAALRSRLEGFDAFLLAGLYPLASLAASLTIGLAAMEPGADLDALWDAANLEELWQADLWGKDAEAEARLAKRRAEFMTAAEFARLARA